ncbi:MAG: isoprenyl transferase [Candidatus Omnitrophota bacterium]
MTMEVPYHIAVIMDGNGRWAKRKGLPRIVGHRQGAKRVKEIIQEAQRIGVKVLTFFAFSTENWSRPQKEVELIFSYLVKFLGDYGEKLKQRGIRFRAIGRRDRIDKRAVKAIGAVENLTRECKKFILNVALDYGGRWDIINAAKKVAKECVSKSVFWENIDEKLFSKYLSLQGAPAPDLLIRTSGEKRISNFLIWDLAYSEFYFTPVLWPDFNKEQLHKAIKVYSGRERRFGKIH